jgi:hypothetical protein
LAARRSTIFSSAAGFSMSRIFSKYHSECLPEVSLKWPWSRASHSLKRLRTISFSRRYYKGKGMGEQAMKMCLLPREAVDRDEAPEP